jgi:hypothetical protein
MSADVLGVVAVKVMILGCSFKQVTAIIHDLPDSLSFGSTWLSWSWVNLLGCGCHQELGHIR